MLCHRHDMANSWKRLLDNHRVKVSNIEQAPEAFHSYILIASCVNAGSLLWGKERS